MDEYKIKLRGGPMKGKGYVAMQERGDRLIIDVPLPPPVHLAKFDPYTIIPRRRGHYQRTNVTTKAGVPVFQWMGYEGEVIAR